MTLATATSKNLYTGTNSTDTYSYTFKIFDEADLTVTVLDLDSLETILVLNVDYTVTGVGDEAGGSIVLTAGNLADDYTMTIRRVRELIQETDIRNQGDFFPEAHEDEFDKLTMVDQQQQNEIDRCPKFPDTIPIDTFDMNFPTDIRLSPGSMILINDDATGFVMGPDASDIAAAQAAAATATAAAAAAAATNQANNVDFVNNLSIATSVSGNALTITFKAKDGTALSASNVASINFRSSTNTSAVYSTVQIQAAGPSVVIPSGATMGQSNGVAANLYVYAINAFGTIEVAVCGASFYNAHAIVTTTAIDTNSDSASVLYSTNVRASVAAKLIGVITNTQAAAGTWASAGTFVENVGVNSVALVADSSGLNMGSVGANAIGVSMTATGAVSIATKFTGQLKATTTNDSAASGYVGEFISATRLRSNALGLATGVTSIVTTSTFSLTAGDWEISGYGGVTLAATTVCIAINFSVSTTSATLSGVDTIGVPTAGEVRTVISGASVLTGAGDYVIPIGPYRVSIASTTGPYYLVCNATFSTSTASTYGSVSARRMR